MGIFSPSLVVMLDKLMRLVELLLREVKYMSTSNEEFKMIEELVEYEFDAMDMESLYQFVTDKLWKYYSEKDSETILELYEEMKNENKLNDNWDIGGEG
jgi:hypothetical protein